MKKVQLNLNGKTTFVGGPTAKAQRVLDFIRSIPKGKFYDIPGIARCLNCSPRSIEHALSLHKGEYDGHAMFIPNGTSGGPRKIFGSKAGIVQLAKQLQEQDVI